MFSPALVRHQTACWELNVSLLPLDECTLEVCGPSLRRKLQEVIDFEKSKTVLFLGQCVASCCFLFLRLIVAIANFANTTFMFLLGSCSTNGGK